MRIWRATCFRGRVPIATRWMWLPVLVTGCSTTSAPSSASTDAATDALDAAAPAHCAIDPAFHERDAAPPGSCIAARYHLACSAAGGATALCLSDDPNRCDGTNVATSGCTSQCAANEYGAVCGGVSPPSDGGAASPQEAPKSCRNAGITPAGTSFYCCPCE